MIYHDEPPFGAPVPDLPSDMTESVSRDDLMDAIHTHRESSSEQWRNLPQPVRDAHLQNALRHYQTK